MNNSFSSMNNSFTLENFDKAMQALKIVGFCLKSMKTPLVCVLSFSISARAKGTIWQQQEFQKFQRHAITPGKQGRREMKQQKRGPNEGVNKKIQGAHPESDFRRRVATKSKLPSLSQLMHRRSKGFVAGDY